MMKTAFKWLIVGAVAIAGGKMAYVLLKMKDFEPQEFGASLPFLSFSLLEKLQSFRDAVGSAVEFSSADSGGLFRRGNGTSQHYFGRAADIKWPGGVSRQQAFEIAKQVGFTGIGVYPWGMHLDVRPGSLATWGRVYYPDGSFVDVSVDEWFRRIA